jgi:hypothetical protein
MSLTPTSRRYFHHRRTVTTPTEMPRSLPPPNVSHVAASRTPVRTSPGHWVPCARDQFHSTAGPGSRLEPKVPHTAMLAARLSPLGLSDTLAAGFLGEVGILAAARRSKEARPRTRDGTHRAPRPSVRIRSACVIDLTDAQREGPEERHASFSRRSVTPWPDIPAARAGDAPHGPRRRVVGARWLVSGLPPRAVHRRGVPAR